MTNEIYHILGASIRAAKLGLGSGIIILLKPRGKGKTHTSRIVARDNKPYVLEIPSGTEAGIYEFLMQTHALVYYIDDKTKWTRQSFPIGCGYIKIMSDGQKRPLTMTHFTKEQVKEPEICYAWSWFLLNKPQFDSAEQWLSDSGLLARAIKLRSLHTDTESLKIQKYYNDNNFDDKNLPTLKIHFDWFEVNAPRKLSDNEWKIINEFPEDERNYIGKIAKVMSKEGFNAVLPCLKESSAGTYFMEKIEFERQVINKGKEYPITGDDI